MRAWMRTTTGFWTALSLVRQLRLRLRSLQSRQSYRGVGEAGEKSSKAKFSALYQPLPAIMQLLLGRLHRSLGLSVRLLFQAQRQ